MSEGLPASGAAAPSDLAGVLSAGAPSRSRRLEHDVAGLGRRVVSWLYRGFFDERGRLTEVQAVGRDVTEQVNLERRLQEAQRMETVAVLAGGVAHEFNNDLQSILATTRQLDARRGDPEGFAGAAERLEEQVKRSARHARQLLVFAHRDVSRREPLDLNDVVGSVTAQLRSSLPRSIALSLELAQGPLPVDGDRGHLEQALANLAENAVEAMPRGGTLAVRTGHRGVDWAWVEVRDTGTGIPDEVRARVFEPFFTTKPGGAGLGLSVTHGVVTGMGGRVEIASEVGAGTTALVALPLRADAGTAAGPGPEPGVERTAQSGRGERILLVEDEEGARDGLVEALGVLGYAVTAVGSGEEALAEADRGEFDLLLTDLKLPGIQGGEVARSLAARLPRLAVILMSGFTEDAAIRAQASRGAARFLQKPFDMATLARAARGALDERGR